ncbi:von Willebrand factor type A domain protein [Mycolicibacterium hassiacum DSM 44199]|uniref:von Willebrand factor type A domain protein n=1 Tax=Mycolicibacterium hassiacum (strain DSM 44199 / CIP 105218 / JCM 12690 / 3849) TaxID=1122247 RepID=K5BGH8_MYCHD|nr:von Willebrand factor type A domain protein [Mycolicibacterium hassiacum DSM 44199]MDA4087617.1 von Willebrand factor A [Mycolicibacterium hassiacum DSM 44199]
MLAGCTADRETSSPTTPAAPPESSAPVESSVPTVLIIDGSGSMNETDAPGPRIDAAKSAAHRLIDALPGASRIALETYGTTTGSAEKDRPAGCRDVTLLLPLGPLDRDAVNSAVDTITPSGYTPISLALETAAEQLPADDSAQAIVLISDGEETCDTPPCDTATRIKQSHPGLTVSTVGFKVDGAAADQLRCIADATGGLYVQAANADQLAARLLATRNLDEAHRSLTSSGRAGIELGASIGEIRSHHPDFPEAAQTGTVTVKWIDCDYTFTDGRLVSIAPHDGGRTIDGVATGDDITKAVELYGKPLATTRNSDNTTTVVLDADPNTDHAYRMTVENYAAARDSFAGTIRNIVLCRCKPRAPTRPEGVTDDTVRNMTFPVASCGVGERGWVNTVPIKLTDGRGEARTATGDFGGVSIADPELVGWLDVDGDGIEDAVIVYRCIGSTFDLCCAGRGSNDQFVRVFDFSDPAAPRPVGDLIAGGTSPVRGENYGETRRINRARVAGSAIITEETLIYPDSADPAGLSHPPDATIEVTHRYTPHGWESTERVIR